MGVCFFVFIIQVLMHAYNIVVLWFYKYAHLIHVTMYFLKFPYMGFCTPFPSVSRHVSGSLLSTYLCAYLMVVFCNALWSIKISCTWFIMTIICLLIIFKIEFLCFCLLFILGNNFNWSSQLIHTSPFGMILFFFDISSSNYIWQGYPRLSVFVVHLEHKFPRPFFLRGQHPSESNQNWSPTSRWTNQVHCMRRGFWTSIFLTAKWNLFSIRQYCQDIGTGYDVWHLVWASVELSK